VVQGKNEGVVDGAVGIGLAWLDKHGSVLQRAQRGRLSLYAS
jgi:hypothetical protein